MYAATDPSAACVLAATTVRHAARLADSKFLRIALSLVVATPRSVASIRRGYGPPRAATFPPCRVDRALQSGADVRRAASVWECSLRAMEWLDRIRCGSQRRDLKGADSTPGGKHRGRLDLVPPPACALRSARFPWLPVEALSEDQVPDATLTKPHDVPAQLALLTKLRKAMGSCPNRCGSPSLSVNGTLVKVGPSQSTQQRTLEIRVARPVVLHRSHLASPRQANGQDGPEGM